MSNRARVDNDPEAIRERFGAKWLVSVPNTPTIELFPKGLAPVVCSVGAQRVIVMMLWDLLGGATRSPMTNARLLGLQPWRRLAENPENRCLVPLTEFCELTPTSYDLAEVERPVRAEMWFACKDQPISAVAGLWQRVSGGGAGFALVTCAPNELVAPFNQKAMVTVLNEEDWQCWLHGSYDEMVDLQRPYPAERMTVRGPVFPMGREA